VRLVTGVVLVPGLGGRSALIAAALALAVATAVGVSVYRSSPGRVALVSVAAFVAIAFFGITRFPDELHTRQLQWKNQRADTRSTAMDVVERENGVPSGFLRFVARRVPAGDSFAVVIGPGRISSAPQSLSQWELMPRREEYGRLCAARWIVFFGHAPRVQGVELAPAVRYAAQLWLARVKAPCTR
jgi:hypothetical protein